jgi:small-conductance mechanosensitive channel
MEVLSHTMNGSLSNKPESTSLNGSSGIGEEEAGLKAAQNLVRTILGDNSATLTRSSCYEALEQHFERLSELELTMAKVEKIKGRRDALADPIKRLTLKLQTAAKERHAAHKQAAKQEKEMERLRRQLKDSQEAVKKLSQQNAMLLRGDQPVIACEESVLEEAENDNSLNLLEDTISESPADPLSEESEEELKERGPGASSLSRLLEEKERKIEILEEYLMVESGVKSPVNYWEMQLAFCATSILPEGIEKMDEALMQLRLQGAKVDISTWNNFVKFWASSGVPDAPEKMEGLVEFMRKVSLYSCSVLVLVFDSWTSSGLCSNILCCFVGMRGA